MIDLIIHMGLPKTGSTTIQNKLWKKDLGFVGKLKGSKKQNDFGKQLKYASPAKKGKIVINQAHNWCKRLQQYINSEYPGLERIIVSHEDLSSLTSEHPMTLWPLGYHNSYVYDNQIIRFLYELSQEAWTVGKVKILLVLRNQPEWLASLYAQISKVMKGASQQDFEKRINKIVEGKDDYLDWSKWVNDLYNYFGTENVCILLLEDMKTESFWQRLAQFTQTEMDPEQYKSITDSYLNKRRESENIWTIPSIRPIKYIKTNWKPNTNRFTYTTVLQTTRFVSTFIDITRFDRERGTTIELHDELRKQILDYCRPFNEKLAEKLGMDLHVRGYF